MVIAKPDKPMTPNEIAALCSRLEARAESKLMVATPEQRSDMRTAAKLLREALNERSTREDVYDRAAMR